MAVLRRMLEWYLGLPGAKAGERTDWRFEVHAPGDPWFAAAAWILAAVAAIYLVAVYRRDAGTLSRWRRSVLTALRLAAVALAALCLFQLTLTVGRIGLPVIALLIDDS